MGVIDASLLKDELRNFSRPVPTLISPNHMLPGAAVWEGWECASSGLATVVGKREEPLMETLVTAAAGFQVSSPEEIPGMCLAGGQVIVP